MLPPEPYYFNILILPLLSESPVLYWHFLPSAEPTDLEAYIELLHDALLTSEFLLIVLVYDVWFRHSHRAWSSGRFSAQ